MSLSQRFNCQSPLINPRSALHNPQLRPCISCADYCFLIPLLLVITFLSFGLLHLAPGSPFDKERKPASPEVERNLARKSSHG